MLHRSAYSVIHGLISVGYRFSFHCYKWNEAETAIEVITDRRKLFKWRVIGTIQILYLLFNYFRLYDSFVIKGLPFEKCVVQLLLTAAFGFYSITTINSVMKAKEVAEFLTNFLTIDKQIQPLQSQLASVKSFGTLLRALYGFCQIVAILMGPLFLALPQNPNFIFSLISPHLYGHPFFYRIVMYGFAVFEIWIALSSWLAGGLIHTITFCSAASCFPLWSKVMKYELSWRPLPMSRQKYFRIVQLLLVQFNDCYAYQSYLTVTASAYFGLIICVFASIRYYSRIPMLAYSIFPTAVTMITLYIMLLFPYAGRTAESHSRMVRQWRYVDSHQMKLDDANQRNKDGISTTRVSNWEQLSRIQAMRKRKYNERFNRSCREVGFYVGPLFMVKPGTTFTFFDKVIDQLINCLIGL